MGAGDTAEGGAYGHADASGVALAQHVARHHFARNEQVRAAPASEMNGSGLIRA